VREGYAQSVVQEVMYIDEAKYKLTDNQECTLQDEQVVCVVDVKMYFKQRCDDRRDCNVLVGRDLQRYAYRLSEECMELKGPDDKSFVDVTYVCRNGKHLCCRYCYLLALNFLFATLGGASIEYRLQKLAISYSNR